MAPGFLQVDGMETIREARATDRVAIDDLLRGARLPVPRPKDPAVDFVVAEDEGSIAGCCGWELHGGHALVRSVVVDPRDRGRGLGERLVEEALRRIRQLGPRSVTLVTLDADRFFARLGFSAIDREEVPDPVRTSPVWSAHLCHGGQWMRLRD